MPALETLIRPPSGNEVAKPLLATSWEIAPDGKSITFILRRGVKFHDGTDFNAQAVKYNFDLHIQAKTPEFALVTSVDVVDDYRVRLNLSQWNSMLFFWLGIHVGLINSPTAIKNNGVDWAMRNPVGTGPFKLASFEKDVSIKYQRFEGYWDKGKPYLDGVEYLYIKDPLVAAAAFQAGQADLWWISGGVSPKSVSELQAKGYTAISIPSSAISLFPDSKNTDSPFADKRVRQAVEYAIDKPAIAKALGYGFWEPLDQPTGNGYPSYNTDLKPRSYDPAKAKQLLADAGYSKGLKITLTYQTGTIDKDALVAVQRFLGEVGIEVTIDPADAGRWLVYRQQGWKNGLIAQTFSIMNRNNFFHGAVNAFPPDYFLAASALRPTGYAELVNQGLAAKDFDSLKTLGQKAVRLLFEETAFIPLYSTKSSAVKQRSVRDDGHMEVHSVLWYPADTWISK
ncbi:MAG: hypothetical protein HYX83_02995 [Chloroflexi bacterium]|nr:hypothetical protein [Chloroflexota bacterium]